MSLGKRGGGLEGRVLAFVFVSHPQALFSLAINYINSPHFTQDGNQ